MSPKRAYHQGESCRRQLHNSPKKIKYRDSWMRCIEKFQQVYRLDPDGPWAPAGLYMSGLLYQELAEHSGRGSDLQESHDIYQRIIKRYPSSRYRSKAALKLDAMAAPEASRKSDTAKSVHSSRAAADSTDNDYREAESCYGNLRQNAGKMKYRENWMQCIDKFYNVYRSDPDGPQAAAGLFMTGRLYADLYDHSRRKADLQAAQTMYEKVIGNFADSRFRVKAELLIEDMPPWIEKNQLTREDDLASIIDPKSGAAASGAENQAADSGATANGLGTVENLRFWSNPNYTRVVIDASQETAYYHNLLRKDPALNKPQRLYVDLKHTRLGNNIKKIIPINDDLLTNARAGQYTQDSVRVVVDIKSFKTYKIFSLKDPYRIVIDVWGEAGDGGPAPPVASAPSGGKLPASALAKQLALGVSRIIIDPGHGGKDYGAPGYLKGVHEKDVVLQIARRLAKKVRQELKCEVFLTRNRDEYLTLEERTAIANTKNADLFISIHTNSHKDNRAYGIETYFLNLATDDDAIRVAAMENATSTKNISDLQTILFDLMQNAKINESSRLAGYIQSTLVNHLKTKRYNRIKDKGVKQAPFYVLLGAQMPAVLVETSFISNPRECKRLVDPQYQERLCEAIILGIRQYIKETSPTAFFSEPPNLRENG